MLKCRDIAERASDYVDRNQSFGQRMEVAFHLLMCGKCRAFIRHLRIALLYFRGLPPPQLDDAEAAAIARRVTGE
jgi:hypothetical protein